METIFKGKKLSALVESKQTPITYPATIGGITFSNLERVELKIKKRARFGLILSIMRNLIRVVVGKQDLVDSWDLIYRIYIASDQQQILFVTKKTI